MNSISWGDFEKIDIRVATIIEAQVFEQAKKPAYILKLDFGDLGILQSSAQITKRYTVDELIGKQVVAVVNFPPKQIANFFSQCLVLGVVGENKEVTLLTPDKSVNNGLKIA